MTTRIQLRRDSEADWLSADPTLAAGEPGYVTDTGEFVVGDGATAFSSLDRFAVGSGASLPLVKATRTTLQSIPASTVTKVALNAEQWDVDGAFASGTYTGPRAMKVQVLATALFESGAGVKRLVRIHHNGNPVGRSDTAPISGGITTVGVVTDIEIAQNDTIELHVFHDDSAALDLQAGAGLKDEDGNNIAAFMSISELVEAS